MARPVIAVLASGEGTTAEAVIIASATNSIQATVGLVIASNPKAGILNRVAKLNQKYGLNVKAVCIGKSTYPNPNDEEAALLKILEAEQFDAIVLLGYMKKIGRQLVNQFGWRTNYSSPFQASMLNTHPGLLPATKGRFGIHVQELVLADGLDEAGQTLHIVSEEYDDGPVVAEHRIKVIPRESSDQLFDRVKVIEKQYIANDIDSFITKRQNYLKEVA